MKKQQPGYSRIRPLLAAALLAALPASAGIYPPLTGFSPADTPARQFDARFGFEYTHDDLDMFQDPGSSRELFRAPDLTLVFGMAENVELVMNFPLLWLKQDGGSFEAGAGDLKVTGIYNLLLEKESLPSCSLMISTKLPNADDAGGFGTDQTDFLAGGIFSKHFGDLFLAANASLAILEDPWADEPNQDDVLVYGIGAVYALSGRLSAGCGVDGIANSRLGNDRSHVRAGLTFETDIGTFDLSGGTGLNRESGDLLVTAGFTTRFSFLDSKEGLKRD